MYSSTSTITLLRNRVRVLVLQKYSYSSTSTSTRVRLLHLWISCVHYMEFHHNNCAFPKNVHSTLFVTVRCGAVRCSLGSVGQNKQTFFCHQLVHIFLCHVQFVSMTWVDWLSSLGPTLCHAHKHITILQSLNKSNWKHILRPMLILHRSVIVCVFLYTFKYRAVFFFYYARSGFLLDCVLFNCRCAHVII